MYSPMLRNDPCCQCDIVGAQTKKLDKSQIPLTAQTDASAADHSSFTDQVWVDLHAPEGHETRWMGVVGASLLLLCGAHCKHLHM